VRRFGGKRVWDVGLDVFGYPPSWCTSGREFKTLSDALNRHQK